MSREIRVRIAPSPTGDPHVGTAYTALFNYVFAKKHGGKFILRIEDTDQTRARASSEQQIFSSLKWLGLNWDEGPDCGGLYGPYRQSERLDIYREYTQKLVDSGHAYACFCTAERLDRVRAEQKAQNLTTRYDGHCRNLSKDEVAKQKAAGTPHVIRLRVPTDGVTRFEDLLRGELQFDNERIDDQVLMKTDGFPTYHLANVVDDHLMKITHVIRAEEWISSTPKHVLLYRAFGWEEPVFSHLPLLRNSDRSKISKRKNPVSLTYYRRAGMLPEAIVNFLALMGWSYGDDKEIFTLKEMIEVFDLKKISIGGPVFDMVKLTWLNQHYMHKMDEDSFVDYIREEIFNKDFLRRLKPLALERMSRFEQFVDNNAFFFNGALDYKHVEVMPASKDKDAVREMLQQLLEQLDELYDWQNKPLHDVLNAHREKIGWKPKDYFMTIRLIVTGRKDSPPLTESMELIGREIVRFRIRNFMDTVLV
ncbi:MAG TPA: glutamate--tRNA ligase [Oligoflexus sp.]|uniref:glutamate--tRNA ligase n=1 Tax=Oligoflexus sp. TaxID=1971216 RepID=UPI002D7E8D4E|nr:glutamate--tRNA ligase [Oligoflexus sp.]HET9239885.1 glutamate--tRNA ligase [Oligoflexus sp.]